MIVKVSSSLGSLLDFERLELPHCVWDDVDGEWIEYNEIMNYISYATSHSAPLTISCEETNEDTVDYVLYYTQFLFLC